MRVSTNLCSPGARSTPSGCRRMAGPVRSGRRRASAAQITPDREHADDAETQCQTSGGRHIRGRAAGRRWLLGGIELRFSGAAGHRMDQPCSIRGRGCSHIACGPRARGRRSSTASGGSRSSRASGRCANHSDCAVHGRRSGADAARESCSFSLDGCTDSRPLVHDGTG